MNKRILSIVVMLALAFSLAIGTAVVSNAADGDGYSLNLAENINVQVTFGGKGDTAVAAEYKIGDYATKVAVPVKSNGNAVVIVPVAVKDLDKDVQVTVYNKDGVALDSKTVNAATYCDALAGDATYGALVNALKAYSAAAKAYFAKDDVDAPAEDPVFGESTMSRDGKLPAGLTHYSATLILESETTIRHYFKLEEGKKIDDYRFWVDLDEDGGYDKDEAATPFANGAYYCVDVTGITPNDLDKAYTVFASDYTDTYSCTYGALDYARNVYGKEGAANYVKALAAALNEYLAQATEIGANIIYKDGETELDAGWYSYGVDTYIDFAPEKDGYVFAGWVDASGNKVNCLPAGTTGDVVLNATWVDVPVFSASSDSIISDLANKISAKTATADGVTTLTVDKFAMPAKTFIYPTVNGKNFAPAFTSVAGDYKYAKAELEFGKVAGKDVLPFRMRVINDNQFFNIATDGAVYLGGGTDAKYKIAQLKDGELSTVEFYMDFTGADMTHANSNTEEYKALNTQTIVLHATNMDGEAISITCSGKWYSDRMGIGQMFWSASYYTTDASYGIMMGKQEWTAVPYMNDSFVVDASTGDIVSSYNSGDAARLPMDTYNAGYTLAGWYADEALTQPINSIPAGNFGAVEVYGKWISAHNSGANVAGNGAQFHEPDTNYADLITKSGMCYTYSVAFDKTSSATANGQIRLRNSGLEPIFAEDGSVVGYKDWAKYYQYIYTDPTNAKYVGSKFDGILEDLGIELRAKNDQGEYVMYTPEDSEKQYHEIDEAAWEEYMYGIKLYNPNSNVTNALRYNYGIIKTMNGKILANALTEDVIITFVFDFANTELRYYVNNEYACTEQLTVRDDSVPVDGKHNCNIFFDKNGGLQNYAYYNSVEPFALVNWQNTANVNHSSVTFTFGDIYNEVDINYELSGGEIKDTEYTESFIAGIDTPVLPTNVVNGTLVFGGWYLDADCTNKASVENLALVRGGVTLYAEWIYIPPVAINYATNGGTLVGENYSNEFVPGYANITLPWATKDGAIFTGWYLDESFTVKASNDALNEIGKEVILYAKWDVSRFTVGASSANGYLFSNTTIGTSAYAAGVNSLTVRFATSTSGSANWIANEYVRVRSQNGTEFYVFYFADDSLKTEDKKFVLTTPNSGDVIDFVLDFTNKTCTYYVNGEFAYEQSNINVKTDIRFYDYATAFSEGGSTAISRNHFIQVGATATTVSRTFARDYVAVYFGDIYNHVDADGDHNCDDCGLKEFTACFDAEDDNDHNCDICGKADISDCADVAGDGDHNCEVCGKADVSDHVETDSDFVCDECGAELTSVAINYVTNGGTNVSTGYTETYLPGAHTVTLPSMLIKPRELFVGWFMDEAFTQKATAEALAAVEADVSLYAKFVDNTVAATTACSGTQVGAKVAASSEHLNVTGSDKAITLRLVLDAVNVTEGDVGASMRVRPATGGKEVFVAKYNSGVYKTGTQFYGNKAVYTLGSGDQVLATNSADKQTVIDIVMNFANNTVTYYVDNVKVAHVTNAGFQTLDQYDCTGTYPLWQWNGTSKHHTVYAIYGDIHHFDANRDHVCDDCNAISDCVDKNCDCICDVCEKEFESVNIIYNANDGTYTDGAITKYAPGVSKVTLPWATKDGVSFAGWYLDEALTQKATDQALAEETADVTLYAKFVTFVNSTPNKVTNDGAITDNSTNYGQLMTNADKALTVMFFAEQITDDITPATGGYLRIRTRSGGEEKKVIYFKNGIITTMNGTMLVDTNQTSAYISFVFDFANKRFDYYVNNEYVCSEAFTTKGTLLPVDETEAALNNSYSTYSHPTGFAFIQFFTTKDGVPRSNATVSIGNIYTYNYN